MFTLYHTENPTMSVDQAQALIKRVAEDATLRERLESADYAEKHKILQEEGFGDVRLSHLVKVLPPEMGGEATEQELSGGLNLSVVGWVSAVSAVTGAVASAF